MVLLQLAGASLNSMLPTQVWLGGLDVPHVFVHYRRCSPGLGPCVCVLLRGAILGIMMCTQAWLVELDVPHVFVPWSGGALKTADF